jgi:hypothetical protein
MRPYKNPLATPVAQSRANGARCSHSRRSRGGAARGAAASEYQIEDQIEYQIEYQIAADARFESATLGRGPGKRGKVALLCPSRLARRSGVARRATDWT